MSYFDNYVDFIVKDAETRLFEGIDRHAERVKQELKPDKPSFPVKADVVFDKAEDLRRLLAPILPGSFSYQQQRQQLANAAGQFRAQSPSGCGVFGVLGGLI